VRDDATLDISSGIRDSGPAGIPALTLLYHPDLARVGECARLGELLGGTSVPLSRLEPEFRHPGRAHGVALGDPFLSRRTVLELSPSGDDLRLVPGAPEMDVVVGGTPLTSERLIGADELARGVVLELQQRVALLLHTVGPDRPLEPRLGLIGDSETIERLRGDIVRVADVPVPVLLRGETGTGKELVARAIHQASARADRPCVCVNMAAIPQTTAASELFGHTRGAFTGAVKDHRGFFSRAHGGTLLLDEIGETPLDVQVMLLRVLETGEIHPVGGHKAEKVDVRLLAATDANLEQAILQGRFREALLHRLSGYQLRIPPLRERRDDFGRLFVHFLGEELAAVGQADRLTSDPSQKRPWMKATLVARLARYDWPGNVRQLRNAVRQLVISSRGESEARIDPVLEKILSATPSPEDARPGSSSRPSRDASPERSRPSRRKPSDISEQLLIQSLRENKWRTGATAAQLGISRTSLYALIGKSKLIRKASDIPEAELVACRDECKGDLAAMAATLEASDRGIQLRMKALGLLKD
jgi:two-component system nitrogen regulation response regulator GlnG